MKGRSRRDHALSKLTRGTEEQRHIAEKLTEEELAIFDLITRPDTHLTRQQENDVKQVARQLLATVKTQKLVLDWRQRQETRAGVRVPSTRSSGNFPTTSPTTSASRKAPSSTSTFTTTTKAPPITRTLWRPSLCKEVQICANDPAKSTRSSIP
jgi:hypothetical protein